MDKYKYYSDEYAQEMIEEVADQLVLEYEEGVAGEVVDEFVVTNDYVSQLVEYWIDNKTIPTDDCKVIVDNLNFDIFEEHEFYEDRPKSWRQAGQWALDDAIHTDENIEAIYQLTNKKLQELWKK